MASAPLGAAIAVAVIAVAAAAGAESGWAIGAGLVAALLLAALPRGSGRPEAVTGPALGRDGLAATLSAFPDPAILVDRRVVVAGANEPALALLPGLRLRRPLALGLRDPQVLEAVGSVLATGEPATVEFGGRIGNAPALEARLRAVMGGESPDPGTPAVALFIRDRSAELRVETMRVDFVANVSHELRTPLASLVGFIDTLRGAARADAAARERFLAIMGEQAARMTRLIDDLLQLSRVELREHLLPAGRIDLAATAAHMVEVMRPLARERGVEVALDLPPEPAEILGDRDEILRLVENLVENAVKYGGAGKRVEVAITPGDGAAPAGSVELSVQDFGPGIAAEHLPRLTERFYRVDVTESRREGGTGLGLAIVKHIVGRHRGRLSIESEPGQGARFRVRFPTAPPPPGPVS